MTPSEPTGPHAGTFLNPLLPRGPDPWVLWHEGEYFYMHTMKDRLVLWRTADITDLANAVHQTIWLPTDPANSHNLWAPEIHIIRDTWYVYYAADDGNSDTHQLYVIENKHPDPFEGSFAMKGRIRTDPDDNWAIDGTVIEYEGEWYLFWSGWETRRVDVETQCIYVARMKDPWTLGSKRVLISRPELEWERRHINEHGRGPDHVVYVNEGPQALRSPGGNSVHVVYSASGCWTPHYTLGMLSAKAGSDLLDPASWTKAAQPVFQQSPENGVYGTGHNSFFKSPDGTEEYILYHARDTPGDPAGVDTRSPRAQTFTWNEDETPDFGVPVPTARALPKPSGTMAPGAERMA